MTRQLLIKFLEPVVLLLMAIPTLWLVWTCMVRGYPLFSVPWTFLSGWAMVSWRSLAAAEWNLAAIATGIVCVAGVSGLLHLLAAWLYREVRVKQDRVDWPAAWRMRWTLCLLAGIVMMFIAGLVGVGLFRTTSWFIDTPEFFKDDRRIM